MGTTFTQASIQASRTALREKTALLETMLDRMDQGVMMVNAQGVVDICNRRAIELRPAHVDAIGKGRFAQRLASRMGGIAGPEYIRDAITYVTDRV